MTKPSVTKTALGIPINHGDGSQTPSPHPHLIRAPRLTGQNPQSNISDIWSQI